MAEAEALPGGVQVYSPLARVTKTGRSSRARAARLRSVTGMADPEPGTRVLTVDRDRGTQRPRRRREWLPAEATPRRLTDLQVTR